MWITTVTTNNTFSTLLWWNFSNQIDTYIAQMIRIKNSFNKYCFIAICNEIFWFFFLIFCELLGLCVLCTPVFVDVTCCICESHISVVICFVCLQIEKMILKSHTLTNWTTDSFCRFLRHLYISGLISFKNSQIDPLIKICALPVQCEFSPWFLWYQLNKREHLTMAMSAPIWYYLQSIVCKPFFSQKKVYEFNKRYLLEKFFLVHAKLKNSLFSWRLFWQLELHCWYMLANGKTY